MIEVVDEFHSANPGEDTVWGMKENAGRGYFNGGRVPVGYRVKKVIDGDTERSLLEPDPVYAPIVKRIFDMYSGGMGAKEKVKTLNKEGLRNARGRPWTTSNVYYILRNEVYTGTLVWNRRQASSRTEDGHAEVLRIPNSHPAIVGRATFRKVQKLLKERSPKHVHPRSVKSNYLLSGLLYCGQCGAKMTGCPARASRYFYYVCSASRKSGKTVCSAKPVSKKMIEAFVIDRVRENILTNKNLAELVRLTNAEIGSSKERYGDKLKTIDKRLEALKIRLGKLYDALETGRLDLADLAPRIKQLKAEVDGLAGTRSDTAQKMEEAGPAPLDEKTIMAYAKDLKQILGKGTIIEQKSFLQPFIKRIEVHKDKMVIDYMIPIGTGGGDPPTREVLPLVQSGSPRCNKGRTFRAEFGWHDRKAQTHAVRPAGIYRNPIALALEWRKALEASRYSSQADLASHLEGSPCLFLIPVQLKIAVDLTGHA
jgi:hypothetical protein